MTAYALFFTLAAIGISETAYLIRKRITLEKPVCPIGENCLSVLNSKYNNIFGIHNEVFGFLFYLAVSLIAAFLVIGIAPALLWVLVAEIIVAMGTLMSFVFIYLQWRVIHAWCFWCVMSALTIFGMAIILLVSKL